MRSDVHGRGIRERQRTEPVEKTPRATEAPPFHWEDQRDGKRTARNVAARERLELMFGRPPRDAAFRRDSGIRHIGFVLRSRDRHASRSNAIAAARRAGY